MDRTRPVVAALAIVVGLSGCATYKIDDPAVRGGPNQALLYLPWWTGTDNVPDELADRKELETLDLQPGMRLVIRSMPIQARNWNILTFAPTRFDWVVPAAADGPVRYSREDFFFLNWLMIMGRTQAEDDSSGRDNEFVDMGKSLFAESADGDFATILGQATIGRWTDPAYWRDRRDGQEPVSPQAVLKVQSVGSGGDGTHYTAAAMRTRLCGATPGDFGETPIARELVMTVDVLDSKAAVQNQIKTYRLRVLNGDNWFFLGDLKPIVLDASLNERWYSKQGPEQGVYGARADIEVQIAVRLGDEAISHYFPPCLTVRDLEIRLGRKIHAVRRSADYLMTLKIGNTPQKELLDDIVGNDATDRYATFFFSKPNDYAGDLNGKHGIRLDPKLKDKFIVGHRDVLIFGRSRLSGSDTPGML